MQRGKNEEMETGAKIWSKIKQQLQSIRNKSRLKSSKVFVFLETNILRG